MADLAARELNLKVLVVDHRHHVGGLCYDRVTDATIVAKHGPAFLHTADHAVWNYWLRHGNLTRFEPREVSRYKDMLVPFPVTIDAVNRLADRNIRTVATMADFLAGSAGKNSTHDALLAAHVKKRWGIAIAELDPEVWAPLQPRSNWDDR